MTALAPDDLLLQSAELAVTVAPRFGGSIAAIARRTTGEQILWATPWADDVVPLEAGVVADVDSWVRASRGGWQVAIPNGGDATTWQGQRHGFHGAASVAPWRVHDVDQGLDSAVARMSLDVPALRIERTVEVGGSTVTLTDSVANVGESSLDVMWTQHPGLGGALLDGRRCRIRTNARRVRFDDVAPVVGVSASPGDSGDWPVVGSDLSSPVEGSAFLAYLSEFDGAPWVELARSDGSLGARLSWSADVFPYCWFWQELGGTRGAPWYGRARVIGLEPATSWPGQGLAAAAARGTVLRLRPGERRRGATALRVTASIAHDAPTTEMRREHA